MNKNRLQLFMFLVLFAVQVKLQAQEKASHPIAEGKFEPNWESFVKNYQCPEWFRDAKFGIWAHWSAQCVPEQGDWYARYMYMKGTPEYDHHLANYGHPSKSGFMEMDNLWKAENWDPEKMMALYKQAGAKYFVTLANHHDNFDNYNSKYHAWNSVNVGPKKDIVGTWEKIARKNGLYFGVSNHSAHAWHWFQTAYGYDAEGPLAGVRYDAATLTKADGKGKWWEGLDPQDLYTGSTIKMPDGITSDSAVAQWHEANDRPWSEEPPANNPKFTENWYLRCKDLIDTYRPDLIYFDNFDLPLGQAGKDITAHYYNSSTQWHNGVNQAVVTAKDLEPGQNAGIVEDFERGFAEKTLPYPWQTCTCIGDWHYNRARFTENSYKTVKEVVHQLVDIVSKNGNLLLSIPVRGDGSLDSLEVLFLKGMAEWMHINGEAIYGTRPFTVFGEGPTKVEGGMFNEGSTAFNASDIRFTTKGKDLYAIIMGCPESKTISVKSIATGSPLAKGQKVKSVSLLGYPGKIKWKQTDAGLEVKMPDKMPCEYAITLKIQGLLQE